MSLAADVWDRVSLADRFAASAHVARGAPDFLFAQPEYRQAVREVFGFKPWPSGAPYLMPDYEWLREAKAALVELERAPDVEKARPLGFNAGDDEIGAWADKCVVEAKALLHRKNNGLFSLEDDAHGIYAAARNLCTRYGVTLPDCPEAPYQRKCTPITVAHRTLNAAWWRGQAKRMVARRVEAAAISAGEIGKARQMFCTDEAFTRRRTRKARNDQLMSSVTMTNEVGDTMTLAELAATSTANPELRRNELMTRVRGLEDTAELRGDRAYFITLTCPSRFHSAPKGGRVNPKFDGSTPREAQAWHQRAWSRVRAALNKIDVILYGMRVVEPHADGCPHWHLLVFVPKDYKLNARIRALFFKHWLLKDCPDEPGASKARVTVIEVDRRKGSAVAYVAKYLAKNVDGFQLEIAMDRDADGKLTANDETPATAAERIRAWSSAHGIRQFQFFGDAAVTWWREYRRLNAAVPDAVLEAPREAANDGEYSAYLHLVGGVAVKRKARPIATWAELMTTADGSIKLNAYGEHANPAIRGLQRSDDDTIKVLTRIHTWTRSTEVADNSLQMASAARHLEKMIEGSGERVPSDFAPWTRVNNCNHEVPAFIPNKRSTGDPPTHHRQ